MEETTWEIYEFFSGNRNSLRIMENSSYRRSSYKSSIVDMNKYGIEQNNPIYETVYQQLREYPHR
jgi:hypothetical protein